MGDKALVQHQVCIDLPGEPVSCWAETDVTVLLRKHRDVIFDLHISKGASYTVEAPEDWIYDVAQRKRVKQGRFSDGQRYHIWIGRAFKGELVLKRDGKAFQRYSMLQLGLADGSSDPRVKPEPIIIAMNVNVPTSRPPFAATQANPLSSSFGSSSGGSVVRSLQMSELSNPLSIGQVGTFPLPINLSQDADVRSTQYAHITEVNLASVPREIIDTLSAGGAEETAIDPNKIATRNWLTAQLAGVAAFLNDNKKWADELWAQKFRLVKVVHKNAGEKWYVVFSGNQKLRQLMSAARYGVQHEKVLTIAGGAGNAASRTAAAKEAFKGAFKKAGLIALVFTIALDTAEWLRDYEKIDHDGKRGKHVSDLLGKISIDLAKAGLNAVVTSIVVGFIVGFFGTVGLPVWGIVVGTIIVACAVGYGLDYLDKKIHATEMFTAGFEWLGESIKSAATYLEKRMPKDYEGYPIMFTP
ncbi:hypothetical protein DN523_07995 [Burkholderia multivorans]|uniref:hypothetical protein n=1 Tax=Burkholderia multivorans TaxID=87883 RepID=UPI000DABC5F8|nr:hypothetical protein [Burkholderia multivorans]RAD11361.1 hypothetical protein DN523_07995 [Burkholderia multivorans]RAF80619.1 hypothetical protein DN519_23550 [Burkholderia multivorans]